MFATTRKPEDRLKARPQLNTLERRDVPAFTTPVFTAVGPIPGNAPPDYGLVASVHVTSDLAETNNGNAVTVTIQDIRTDNMPVTVNLLTYTRDPANSAPPGDINLQKLYALDTKVLSAPGQSVTLTACLPMCKLYQADVALGTLSAAVKASLTFPDTNIESVFGVDNNCPVPPPPVSPPPPPPCHNPPPVCHGSAPKGSHDKCSTGSHDKGSHDKCSTGSHGKGSQGKGSHAKTTGSDAKGSHAKTTGSQAKGSNGKGGSCNNGSQSKGSHAKTTTGSDAKGSHAKTTTGSSGKGDHGCDNGGGKGSHVVCGGGSGGSTGGSHCG